MGYKSVCVICGRETPDADNIMENSYIKCKMGFTALNIVIGHYENGYFNIRNRSMNFCQSCSKKSYTIEELKTIGNYNSWSY